MTTIEACHDLCKQKYGVKFRDELFDMALSRARLEMFKENYRTLEEFLKWKGCRVILDYYALERSILIAGFGDDMEGYF